MPVTAEKPVGLRVRSRAAFLCVMQEPEVERHEDQDDANVDRQPLPHVAASEEHDVHPDYDSRHRDHVQRASCRPSHGAHVTGGKYDAPAGRVMRNDS